MGGQLALKREATKRLNSAGHAAASKGAPHAAHGLAREGRPGATVSGRTPAQKE
jgi:hypothetical protein